MAQSAHHLFGYKPAQVFHHGEPAGPAPGGELHRPGDKLNDLLQSIHSASFSPSRLQDQQKARLPKSALPRRQNLRSVLSRRRAVFITPYFETKSPWRKAG